jgi:hypothetical protein
VRASVQKLVEEWTVSKVVSIASSWEAAGARSGRGERSWVAISGFRRFDPIEENLLFRSYVLGEMPLDEVMVITVKWWRFLDGRFCK